jgi:hypothetical protein
VAAWSRGGALPFLLAVMLASGCGTSHTEVTVPLSKNGSVLRQFEALLKDRFGNRLVCASGRWAQNFTSGSCKPLASYSPYVYVFRGARHSRFHVTSKKARGYGNYPVSVLLDGKNIACNKQETTFLIKFRDGAGFTLGCSRAGYVSG